MNNNQSIIKKAFIDVENVLKTFPSDCQKNYFDNKKHLKINFENQIIDTITGDYDHEKNIITLYDVFSINHELFHMAFRDKEKINKCVYPNSDVFYSNGLSFKIDNRNVLKGITEGFVEYLTRKCSTTKGHFLNYYFVDLLISIYGEEIIYFPLKNDPTGFYDNKLFNDIISFTKYLDDLEVSQANMTLIRYNNDLIEQAFENNDKKLILKFYDTINLTEKKFKDSIVKLFEITIKEFNNCSLPKINSDDFYKKLNLFLLDSDYNFVFELDEIGKRCIKNEITDIIQNFNNNYQNYYPTILKSKVYKKEKKVN